MAANKDDFLRFSAYSIKDLITRKLSESNKFTDQVYEGSNLTILIDIFANIAQTILYSLNRTAAEAMFSDTQVYQNINRLVKFIGYNPKGCTTANANFILQTSSTENPSRLHIPKYAQVDTEKTDDSGKKIIYSTIAEQQLNSKANYPLVMYNGQWKLYNTVFSSSGAEYQTFTLAGLKSDSESDTPKYIPNGMIDIYVDEGGDQFEQYKYVSDGLFTDNNISNGTKIYNELDKVFNLRLNEDKVYEITFGNGYNGCIPAKGAKIYIFYLDSNGPSGEIIPGEVSDKYLRHGPGVFGLDQTTYLKIFGSTAAGDMKSVGQMPISNTSKSSETLAEESVDEIRTNAPNWFKTGNRVVTNSDYVYYIKNRFRDLIHDVVCQNNWQYISTFYAWLYNLGITKHPSDGGKNYYINQNKLQKYDFKCADAADANNVYLWLKMKNDTDLVKDTIDQEIVNVKDLTQEVVYLKPLTVYFSLCAEDVSTAAEYFKSESPEFDPTNKSYIEITVNDHTLYTNTDIQAKVGSVIKEFFSESNFTLGSVVDYNELTNKILQIAPVERIRTVYNSGDGQNRIRNGISFATWTSDFIDIGDDLDISTTSRSLEQFQFPALYNSESITSKIKVIRKSINNINQVQY